MVGRIWQGVARIEASGVPKVMMGPKTVRILVLLETFCIFSDYLPKNCYPAQMNYLFSHSDFTMKSNCDDFVVVFLFIIILLIFFGLNISSRPGAVQREQFRQ